LELHGAAFDHGVGIDRGGRGRWVPGPRLESRQVDNDDLVAVRAITVLDDDKSAIVAQVVLDSSPM
jgi:hypothetical protein